MDAEDLSAVVEWQTRKQAQPTTRELRLNFAFNGKGADTKNEEDTLTPAASQNQQSFAWISHTYDHENLNTVDYARASAEIELNEAVASRLDLAVHDKLSMVTPEHSGLNNPEFLQAAFDSGIRYLISNTSTPRRDIPKPGPNAGTYNPHQPAILEIPRYPTDLFYNVTTPNEWVAEFRCIYRDQAPHDSFYYPQILENVSNRMLSYLLKGDMTPLMFHQSNLRAYSGNNTLLGDLLDATLEKYNRLYTLPILSPTMDELGERMAEWMAYTKAGVTASMVPGQSITITATQGAVVPVTGLNDEAAESYGGQAISRVKLAAGQEVTLPLR
jgi:hypothetical protein